MPEMTLREFAAMGGRACQANRTPEERSEAGRKAVTIRWMRVRAAAKASKSPKRSKGRAA